MTLEVYLLYLGAVAVFFATPPDTSQLLIIANSARHGLRRSLWTIGGDLSANVIQMTAAAFGLAALIASSAEAFMVIKWAGVAYLAWISFRLMTRRDESGDGPTAAGASSPVSADGGRLFRQGFITSMANPFAVVFFGALFPQFIDMGAPIVPQLVILGVTYLVVDGVILLGWGWLGVRAGALLHRSAAPARGPSLLNRVCGALMIGAAALLAMKDLTPAAQR